MSTPTNTSMSTQSGSCMAELLGSGDILVSDAPGACASTTLRPAPRACPCQRSQAPDRGGRQHLPGHLCDRGIQPYPPRRATSPDTATPEPLNKVKGRFPPATHQASTTPPNWPWRARSRPPKAPRTSSPPSRPPRRCWDGPSSRAAPSAASTAARQNAKRPEPSNGASQTASGPTPNTTSNI